MPGTNYIALPADPRDRRRALDKMTPRDVQCAVPSCEQKRLTDDCCYAHSLIGRGDKGNSLINDGIIDWIAIDVAVRGLRQVRLTWVEKDIAVGMIFARGDGVTEAEELTGARVMGVPRSRRVQAARKIAEALSA